MKSNAEAEQGRDIQSDWITALGDCREVTIWLRSGRQVTGTIEGQFPANARDAAVFRIKNASLVTKDSHPSQRVSVLVSEGKCVLVSVKEIERIDINDSESGDTKVGRTSAERAETPTGGQGQD